FDKRSTINWQVAERHAPGLISRFMARGWQEGVLLNINFPDGKTDEVKGVRTSVQGKRDQSKLCIEQRLDPRHEPYYWMMYERGDSIPAEGTDLAAIENGYISVSPLHLNLTHHEVLGNISETLHDYRIE
ncbi:MAG: 5'/3'-nucleotidase SurE, partial [Hyphomicrobiales bacterium]